MTNDKRTGFAWGLGFAIVGFALTWLLGIANDGDQANKDKLAEMHQAELTACIESGSKCRIEYLKDRTGTIYAARVVKEDE